MADLEIKVSIPDTITGDKNRDKSAFYDRGLRALRVKFINSGTAEWSIRRENITLINEYGRKLHPVPLPTLINQLSDWHGVHLTRLEEGYKKVTFKEFLQLQSNEIHSGLLFYQSSDRANNSQRWTIDVAVSRKNPSERYRQTHDIGELN